MRSWRVMCCAVAAVLAAGGLQAVVRAVDQEGGSAGGLLESRESIYNNIFIFGDKENVTMTFGHNKRYYTESSMRLSDPGLLTVDYTRYMTLGVAYPPKAERIVEIELNSAERDMFQGSVAAVKTLIDACKTIAPQLGR